MTVSLPSLRHIGQSVQLGSVKEKKKKKDAFGGGILRRINDTMKSRTCLCNLVFTRSCEEASPLVSKCAGAHAIHDAEAVPLAADSRTDRDQLQCLYQDRPLY